AARARSLVSVRPAKPIEGDSPRAVIARAEAFIADGEVAASVLELQALPEAATAEMAPWLEKARTRAEIDLALAFFGNQLSAPVR
ncbi:MAG: hypothetical protein ACX939_15365, partial [Hyphococcus sp.]